MEVTVSPLIAVHYGRMRDKAHKLKQDYLGLHIKKNHSPCGQKVSEEVSGTVCPDSLCHLHSGSVSRPKWVHSEHPDLTFTILTLSRRSD